MKKTFKGKVLGFQRSGQPGRTIIIETTPRHVIWLDALDGGASGKIVSATRSGKPVQSEY